MKKNNFNESGNMVKNIEEARNHAKALYVSISLKDADTYDDYVVWYREEKGSSPAGCIALPYGQEPNGAGWDAIVVDEDLADGEGGEVKVIKPYAKIVALLFSEGTDDIDVAFDEADSVEHEIVNDKRFLNARRRKEREQRDIEMSRMFATQTKAKVENGKQVVTTTSSAPVGTPISIEQQFDADDNGRHPDAEAEAAGLQGTFNTTVTDAEADAVVDTRIKDVKSRRLKQAKANAKAIEDANAMSADISKQMEELRKMLEEAREAKRLEEEARRKAEEEARIAAEVKAEEDAMADDQAKADKALADIKAQQDEMLRLMLEMKKELESLNA